MSERSPLLTSTHIADSSHRDAHSEPELISQDQTSISLSRGLVVSATVFLLIFILTYGVAVLTTIQSSIAVDIDVSHGVSWFVSAYLIATTSVTPIAGRLCEIFSTRSYLLVSVIVQAIGLLLTAFARSFNAFIIGRVVSGTGAAAITPVAYLLVTTLADPRRWGLFFGFINCGYTAGIALGAVIGGALESRVGWRAIFWMQAPICLAAGIVAFFTITPKPTTEDDMEQEEISILRKLGKIDYLGVITLVSAVVFLLVALASPTIPPLPLALGAVLLGLFLVIESCFALEPIVPPAVLYSRAMLFTSIATVGQMCARWAVIFYVPTYGIAVRGWTPSESGALLLASNLGFAIGSVVIGILHIKRAGSFYVPSLVSLGLFILEHFGLSRLVTPNSSVWLFVVALFWNGFIAGAVLNYSLAHLLHMTRPSDHFVVIPLNAMFKSFSGSIASSLNGGIFIRTLMGTLHREFEKNGIYGKGELIMKLLSRPMLVQQLHGAEKEVAVESYATSIANLFMMGSLWVIGMLIVQAGVGWAAPGAPELDLGADHTLESDQARRENSNAITEEGRSLDGSMERNNLSSERPTTTA